MNSALFDLCRHIGETVTIFTASGGASGCGFTGVLFAVNSSFIRLVTHQGTPPSNPLAENICGDMGNGSGHGQKGCHHDTTPFSVGSVVDIPVDKIVSFCYNAI